MYREEGFKSLIVWRNAYQFTLDIYKLTSKFPREELYGLTSQLRRASYSIPLNIAEGYTRSGNKEFLQFLTISRGSSAEIETLLLLSRDLGFVSVDEYQSFEGKRKKITKILQGLINSVRKKF